MKKRILDILIVVLTAVFLVSGGLLARNLLEYRRQEKTFQEMSDRFPEAGREPSARTTAAGEQSGEDDQKQETGAQIPLKEQISPEEWKDWWEEMAADRFPVYQSISEKNPDVVGWVRIEDTIIDYPVCYTPENPEYYLHRDINHADSSYGTPFLDAACTLEAPRSSLLIYGHHMRNGRMFAALQNYTSFSYYQQHPYIQFDTLTEAGSYEIAMVLRLDADGNQIPWQKVLFPTDKDEFQEAWTTAEQKQFFHTGVEVSTDDELLALVTCEYTQANGRLMVIARRIQ